MDTPLFRISHSKVRCFQQCRKKYWFRYLSGEDWPQQTPNVPGVVGTGVHRAMKALCDTGSEEDGAGELGRYLRMPAHACAGPGTAGYTLAFDLFEKGVTAHASIESERSWAELDTWVPSPRRGISVRARIDRADRLAGSWQVVDWKTGLYDYDDVTDAQLDIGQLAARTALKVPHEAEVRAVAWNLRTGQQRTRRLSRDDAAGTMDLMARMAARLQETAEFEATPGPQCAYCEWHDRCPDAAAVEAGGWDWPEDELPESEGEPE
jgi:CRISPR/Cas system-associated exonuclease Cas4 (RecB family)